MSSVRDKIARICTIASGHFTFPMSLNTKGANGPRILRRGQPPLAAGDCEFIDTFPV